MYRITVSSDPLHLFLQVSGGPQGQVNLGPFPLAAQWGFGPDDRWLVVHYPGVSSSQMLVDLYDLSAGAKRTVNFGPMTTGSAAVAFSPHGRYLLIAGLLAGNRTVVHLFRTETSQKPVEPIEFTFEPGPGNPGNTFGVGNWGFGPDDQDDTFHYAFVKGNEVKWNVLNLGAGRYILQNFTVAPHALWLFSPCGDIVALVELPTGQSPQIWLVQTLDGERVYEGGRVDGFNRLLVTAAHHIVQTPSGVHQLVANSAATPCAGAASAPYWPAGAKLVASEIGTDSLMLSWDAAKDRNGDLSLYLIAQTDPQWLALGEVDASASRTLAVTGLAPGQWYSFAVYAKDATGLSSSRLDVTVGTLKTPMPPVWPAGARLQVIEIGETEVQFGWPAATDDRGVTVYRIYQDGVLRETVPGTTRAWRATGLLLNQLYTFKVEAGDADGYWTTDGPSDRLLTRDRTPPTWPVDSRLFAASKTATSLGVGWTPAEDNVGVTAYRLYLLRPDGFDPLWDADGQFVYDCLEPGSRFTFKVEAGDAAGNWSTNGPIGTLYTDFEPAKCEERLVCASVSPSGEPGRGIYPDPWFKSSSADSTRPVLSGDGRYVAFESKAFNLVWNDCNSYWEKCIHTSTSTNCVSSSPTDIFIRDLWSGRTERVNVTNNGKETELPDDGTWPPFSQQPAINANGNLVAFVSNARVLDPGTFNGKKAVFVRNRYLYRMDLISRSTSGERANEDCITPAISADGRVIAFASLASNLVPNDTNRCWDVFVRDRLDGVTHIVSVNDGRQIGDGDSWGPAISADGRFVAFISRARSFVSGKASSTALVYLHDRESHTTRCVSVSSGGELANDDCGRSVTEVSYDTRLAISADGRYVAFDSLASNLVPNDANGKRDVFVHDCQTGVTERLSVSQAGQEANAESFEPAMSSDGRYVAFASWATNLLPQPTRWGQVYVRDRLTGALQCVSRCDCGSGGGGGPVGHGECYHTSLSADGRYVAFTSEAPNLILNLGDDNDSSDVFVFDRQPDTADADHDGSPDTDEQGGPAEDPDLDVNRDGQPDWRQFTVRTIFPRVGSLPLAFAVLAPDAGDQRPLLDAVCDALGGDPAAQQSLIRQTGRAARIQAADNPDPTSTPSHVLFPVGFFELTVQEAVEPGGAVFLVIWLPENTVVNTLWKYGPTPENPLPHWYEFLYDGHTGAVFDPRGRYIGVWLVDGARGDDDLATDGRIIDVLAPGLDGTGEPPALDVLHTTLEFGAARDHLNLMIGNKGGKSMSWNIWFDLPAWLAVWPSSGELAPGQSAALSVTADASNLAPGVYSHELLVFSAGGLSRVSVRLTASVQILNASQLPDGGLQIVWRSAPGKVYQVESTDSLAAQDWRASSLFIEATSAHAVWTDYTALATPARFYRVVQLDLAF